MKDITAIDEYKHKRKNDQDGNQEKRMKKRLDKQNFVVLILQR